MPGRWIGGQTAFSQLNHFVKRLPLWLLALLSLGGYVVIRFWFPLTPYFDHVPLLDIRKLAPSFGAGLEYAALLCGLFGLYWLAYRRARQRDAPLPFFFLSTWRTLPHDRARVRFVLGSAMGCLAMAWLIFLPFGSPLDLARRLIREASTGGGFSPSALLVLAVRRCGLDLSIASVVRVAGALFGLLVLWLLWRTWHGRSPLRAAADVFAAYLGQAFKVRIWYSTWPFPWLLLDSENSSRRLAAGLWLLLTGQLSVVIYGHLWVYLFDSDYLLAHLIGVPFVFALPLVMAALWPKDR